MKTILVLIISLLSVSVFADAEYVNETGCRVAVNETAKGKIYFVYYKENDNKKSQAAVVGLLNDYSSADFSYCSKEAIQVNYLIGRISTGVLVSCSQNQNGEHVTKGKARIDLSKTGDLIAITAEGLVKNFMGFFKYDVNIDCQNLEKISAR